MGQSLKYGSIFILASWEKYFIRVYEINLSQYLYSLHPILKLLKGRRRFNKPVFLDLSAYKIQTLYHYYHQYFYHDLQRYRLNNSGLDWWILQIPLTLFCLLCLCILAGRESTMVLKLIQFSLTPNVHTQVINQIFIF